MSFIQYDTPKKNFTQVSNELIWNPNISAANKIAMLQLASLCVEGKSHTSVRSLVDVAKIKKVNERTLRSAVNRAIKAGCIDRDSGSLLVSADGPEEELEPTICGELEDQPKRKNKLKDKEAWRLVVPAWNKNKPEAWSTLPPAFNLPAWIALDSQGKRLNIERENYGEFVAQVCRGGGADEWWARTDQSITGVFGYSAKIPDKKFQNVEKLYKAGANVAVKVDFRSETDVIARYAARKYDIESVEFIEVESERQMQEHVLANKDRLKEEKAVCLYFLPNKERPIYWTYRTQLTYLFD